MKHRFTDLIDVNRVQRLTDLFYQATGMPTAVIDLDGAILTRSGWQPLCTDFHRANLETRRRCIESDTIIANQLEAGQKYTMYKCKNGLVDAATPIAVNGDHLANFFTGQFFLEPPDMDFFSAQARRFKFDEHAYITAVGKIPVISETRVRVFLDFFSEFAQLLAEMGMRQARQMEAEGALLERDSRMNRAQEIAHLGSWELDLVSNRLTWSDEVYRIFGLKPQEFAATYEAFLEAVHPDDRSAVDAAYSGSLAEGRDTYEIEHRVVRKSTGEVRVVHERCQHFRNDSGRIVKSVGMVHDITERKRIEESLEQERDILRAVMNGARNSHLVYLDRDFNFVRVNETYAASCGFRPEEMIGRNHFDLYPHEENQAIFAKVRDTGIPAEYHDKPFVFPEQPERGVTYWDWTLVPLKNRAGQVEGLVFSLTDTTERKIMEEELRRSRDELEQRVQDRTEELRNTNELLQLYTVRSSKKEYLDQVLDLLREWTGCEGIGIRVLDKEGDIPYESYVGFGKEFWESENLLSIHRDQCVCIRVVAGRPEPQDAPYITAKGSFHCDDTIELLSVLSEEAKSRFRGRCIATGFTSVSVVPISYRGEILGAIHLADREKAKIPMRTVQFIESIQPLIGEAMHRFDLEAEQERLRHQLLQAQKMEALGTATGGIAHDFNNILAAVIGFTEVVRGRVPKDSREQHHLDRVLEAGIRGRELIKQMLTFARKTEYERKPVRLSAVVNETINLLRASIPSTIDIRTNVRSESALVMGDENQIQQVLMNLCTNAAYAMRSKGGLLEIELSDFSVSQNGDSREIEPGLYMKLTVRDTGEGIAPEHVNRIFDPFFTTKKVGEGTGLGLSVVHGIVKQHEGYVTVESEQGKGSSFSVYLRKARRFVPSGIVPDKDIPTGSERVLFVDDEEALTEMGQEILEELGYEVTVTNSSLEAMALFRTDPSRYDLIVTDQTMPEMTGMELAMEAMALKPGVPVILCTGFSHVVDADSAAAAGVRAFATKPLTKVEIACILRKVLDHSDDQ